MRRLYYICITTLHVSAFLQMLARLLADPSAVSVESLERKQRQESRSPPAPVRLQQQEPPPQQPGPSAPSPSVLPPMPAAARSADELESDLKSR